MNFRRQLALGQLATLTMTLLVGIAAIVALGVTTHEANQVTYRYTNDSRTAQHLHFHAERLVSAGRGYLLTAEPRYRDRMREEHVAIRQALRAFRVRDPGNAILDRLERHADDYEEALERAVEMRADADGPRAVLGMFERDLQPKRDTLEADLDAFLDREEGSLDAAFHDAATLATDARITIAIATVLAIAMSFVLWRIVRRRLTEQFAQIQAATDVAKRAAAARKELLAVVSHDLRTPLSAIALGAGALLEDTTGPTKRHARIIANAADRMHHLVDELIDVSRVEAGTIELARAELDAREVVEVAVELLREQATRRSIRLTVDGAPTAVRADRERVVQVLTNLAGNALRFAPPGGSVRVRVEPIADRVRFEVRDDGPGIADDALPHVFERHWQGRERRGGGLGLGLYICKHLVELHGGTIGATSTLGAGSTFWFELPR